MWTKKKESKADMVKKSKWKKTPEWTRTKRSRDGPSVEMVVGGDGRRWSSLNPFQRAPPTIRRPVVILRMNTGSPFHLLALGRLYYLYEACENISLTCTFQRYFRFTRAPSYCNNHTAYAADKEINPPFPKCRSLDNCNHPKNLLTPKTGLTRSRRQKEKVLRESRTQRNNRVNDVYTVTQRAIVSQSTLVCLPSL